MKQWTVSVKVVRSIRVTVEGSTAEEALANAEAMKWISEQHRVTTDWYVQASTLEED